MPTVGVLRLDRYATSLIINPDKIAWEAGGCYFHQGAVVYKAIIGSRSRTWTCETAWATKQGHDQGGHAWSGL